VYVICSLERRIIDFGLAHLKWPSTQICCCLFRRSCASCSTDTVVFPICCLFSITCAAEYAWDLRWRSLSGLLSTLILLLFLIKSTTAISMWDVFCNNALYKSTLSLCKYVRIRKSCGQVLLMFFLAKFLNENFSNHVIEILLWKTTEEFNSA